MKIFFVFSLLLNIFIPCSLLAQEESSFTGPLLIELNNQSTGTLEAYDDYQMAQNDLDTIEEPLLPPLENSKRRSPFSKKTIHQFLGLGAIALGLLAGRILPEDDDETNGTHHNLAMGATALGIGAFGSGLLFYSNSIDVDYGITDTYNLHALAGFVGALGYMVSVSNAPDNSHAEMAMAGVLSMSAAVLIVW